MIHRHRLILAGFALVLVVETALAQTTGGSGSDGGGTGGTGTGGGGVTTGGGSGGGMSTFAPTQGLQPNAPSSFLPNSGTTAPGAVSAGNQGNPFNTWYANPLALGLAARRAGFGGSISGTSSIPWGTALYSNVYPITGTTTGARTGLGTAGRGLGTAGLNRGSSFGGGLGGGTLGGFNSSTFSGGTGRTPGYVTMMQPYIRPSGNGAQVAELQQIIARSNSLPSRDTIQVHGEDVIVLRGNVGSERERRLAENVLRLSPGVSAIRNELVVRP
jgi:hypothetical protein